MKGTYIGKNLLLINKTAIVQQYGEKVIALFDDVNLVDRFTIAGYEFVVHYGTLWNTFNKEDFKLCQPTS